MNYAVTGRNPNVKSLCSLFIILLLLCRWIAVVEAQDETVTVEITDLPEGVQNGAFEVTITFSEAVVNFDTGDIAFSDDSVDASVTELTTPDAGETDHKTVYTAEITPADDANGDLTFQVAENVVKSADADADAEDNNTASDSHTVKVDLVPPAVSITDAPTTVKLGAFEVIITFTEPVSDFEADDIQLTGDVDASVTDLTTPAEGTENHRIVWTAEITPDASTDTDGDITLQVPEDVVEDAALNNNAASESQTIQVDVTRPTVSITDVPEVEKNEAFDLTITFSEPVNGFVAGDITLTGPATVSLTTGSDGDTEYTLTITPDDDMEADVTIQVGEDVVEDLVGNTNTASTEHTVHVDTVPPTVVISDPPEAEKNVAFDITITFSEAVNDFAVDDIIRTGPATASLKSGNDGDSVYEITITPNPTSEGDVTFQVPADAATDFAQNPNEASTETDPVHIDTRPPTVEIMDVPDIEKNEAFDVTITFSEPVNGFAVGDITLTGPATISLAEETDSVYRGTITPNQVSEGDVTFHIPAAIAQDFALNDNIASDSHTVHIDTILPTVESITGIPTIAKNEAFDITITFSEPVNGFVAGDITLTGPATASVKSGSDGDTVYEITVTPNPTSEGDVTFQVPADAAIDFAQNPNEASTQTDPVYIDTTPPAVEITGIPDIEKNEAFDVTITFSEPVNGFVAGDTELTGPATLALREGNDGDNVYKVTITPDPSSEEDVIFHLPAAVVKDFALNDNTASDSHTVHIDTIPPTVEITDVPDIEKNVAFDITITFSEPVNGFAVGDITLIGPATVNVTSGSDGDSVYKAKITPDVSSEDDVEFYVSANAVRDLALNANDEPSNRPKVHVDTIPPTVEAITGVPTIEKNVPFDITITFSEPINDFVAGDITLTGPATATLKEGNDGGNVYKVTITPDPSSEEDVIFHLPAAVVKDFALNDNTASGRHTVHIDTIPPTVKSITDVPIIEKNVPFDVTITFSEPVNGFQASGIHLTGPAAVSLILGSDGDTVYKAKITPDDNKDGDVVFYVSSGAAKDFGRNDSTVSTEQTVHVDTISPTVQTTGVPTVEKNVPFDVTITFSEPVNGFQTGDILLTGPATLTLKAGADGDSVYKVTITPDSTSEGDVEFRIPAAAAKDSALNDNIVSESHVVHVDTIPPEVSIAPVSGNTSVFDAVQLEMFFLQIIFSEDVLEFEVTDITLTGDAVVETSELTGGRRTYVLTITPHEDTDGNVIIKVAPGIAKDLANNLNNPSAEHTIYVAPKWIPDPNIRAVVREEIGLDEGEDFAREQLEDLTTLEGAYRQIIDVTGLEYATNLTSLSLEGNSVTDLSPFTDLTELTLLEMKGNQITDLTPLQGLTRLTSLDLRENIISDIEPLTGLVSLTDLYLTTNQISDVSPLADLSNLVTLWISENPIKNAAPLVGLAETIEADIVIPSLVVDPALRDAIRAALGVDSSKRLTISALQTLTTLQAELSGIRNLTGLKHATALTTLELNGNSIIDITPIRGLIQLTTLNLSNNAIVDITPLEGLIALTVLNLSNNPIGSLEMLAELAGLTTLELSGNSINNLEVISGLTGLLKLNISDNSLTDITRIQNLTKLTALNLSNNPIGNLNVISSLTRLTTLELSGNSITDLIPLAELTRLTMLNLNDNAVRNLMPLANLRNLTTLNLGSNAISVLDPITSLRDLKVLDLNNNSISNVSPLASLTQLDTLNLSANTISDVEPLVALINLATLRLVENPILDTTVLYPLTQRVPPVDIDISVSQYSPWDVNQDGRVNAIDSALVTAALGQSGDDIVLPHTDVNGDGTVDNADVLLVTENFDENAAGAPSIVDILAGLRPLDREMLEAQLEILIAESDGSLKSLRTIALLQSLLTKLHPDKTRLLANYPNPFNPETWIPYQLADSSDVQIFIYDVRGAVIRHLKLGHQPAGYYIERKHAAHWDGRNAIGESVASGIYFYQLQTDNISLLREMVILK